MRKDVQVFNYIFTFRTDWSRLRRGCKLLQSYKVKSGSGEDYGVCFGFAWFWLELVNWALEVHPVCAECGSADIGEVSHGDEGWTICSACRSIEQGYRYVDLIRYEEAL